ncbi:uncharacterized protein LOC116430483 isoform X1 [Nomia melanderi]|uniref:uncharacterized protein LOC116430483 isoform X1 n=1 Tax=Nomia melanderi TaxID=2448451 RepID=UPI003FCDDC65
MSKIYQLFLTIYSVLFTPSIALLLSCLYLYRCAIDIILRIQLKGKYVGLLDGADSIWAIEEPSALSVSNVLLIFEKDARHSNTNFLDSFRELVRSRVLPSLHEKLLYKRRKRFGYYYWERSEEIDLKERVRWLEYERTSCDGSCDNVYNGHLKRVLWNACNQPLPEDHAASWEILVGKCCPRSSHHYLRRLEERLASRIKIPVLFRVHHSLGDGMALLKFFKEVIVDKEPMQETSVHIEPMSFRIKSEELRRNNGSTAETNAGRINVVKPTLIGDRSLQCSLQKDVMSASMPFIHFVLLTQTLKLMIARFSQTLKFLRTVTLEELKREVKTIARNEGERMKVFFSELWRKMRRWTRVARIVIGSPACLVGQAFRSMDNSALHGAELTGEKYISYWLEDDFKNTCDQRLFAKIQNIKSITGARFGDVLLAALSVSLHKYFIRASEPVPNSLSVVIPAKIEEWSEDRPLQNNISVGILPLCISQISGKASANPIENSQILERLEDVRKSHDRLKKSSDYMVNFLVMKYLSAILPEKFMRPVLKSHSTLVFSNLVGPREVKVLGHSVKNIAFWIPNRSNTGIGCSLLTYRGYLHLSLIADKALVHNEKALTQILESTVHEIENLYDRLTLSFFSKKLRRSMSTPTKKGTQQRHWKL